MWAILGHAVDRRHNSERTFSRSETKCLNNENCPLQPLSVLSMLYFNDLRFLFFPPRLPANTPLSYSGPLLNQSAFGRCIHHTLPANPWRTPCEHIPSKRKHASTRTICRTIKLHFSQQAAKLKLKLKVLEQRIKENEGG